MDMQKKWERDGYKTTLSKEDFFKIAEIYGKMNSRMNEKETRNALTIFVDFYDNYEEYLHGRCDVKTIALMQRKCREYRLRIAKKHLSPRDYDSFRRMNAEHELKIVKKVGV
jgi:hypothetical protein